MQNHVYAYVAAGQATDIVHHHGLNSASAHIAQQQGHGAVTCLHNPPRAATTKRPCLQKETEPEKNGKTAPLLAESALYDGVNVVCVCVYVCAKIRPKPLQLSARTSAFSQRKILRTRIFMTPYRNNQFNLGKAGKTTQQTTRISLISRCGAKSKFFEQQF
jgi:hypothetical protein